MSQNNFLQRLTTALFTHKQVMVLSQHSGKPAQNWRIRPSTLLAFPLAFMLIGMIVGAIYFPEHQVAEIIPQHIELQRQLERLHDQLASSEAGNDIKQAQIASLEESIQEQQENITKLQQRLNVFESILQTRKGHGTQLLQATIHPINDKNIAFSLLLVKGGSYPRFVRGSIQFITLNKQGKTIPLLFDKNKQSLPYRMETHTFLRGNLHWPEKINVPAKLQPITVILFDRKGRELSRTICTFEEL